MLKSVIGIEFHTKEYHISMTQTIHITNITWCDVVSDFLCLHN